MSVAITSARPVLADRLGATTLLTNFLFVVVAVGVLAAVAQVSIPMFPVPITGQTFGVLLVGACLGAVRALIATFSYVALAVIGLPVLAPLQSGTHVTGYSVLSMPTTGYLVGFVLASAVAGWFAERTWERHILKAVFAFVIAESVIYAVGLPWLSVWLSAHGYPASFSATLEIGLVPFIAGDVVKAIAAGALVSFFWKLSSARRERR